jgi:hypothetical protein
MPSKLFKKALLKAIAIEVIPLTISVITNLPPSHVGSFFFFVLHIPACFVGLTISSLLPDFVSAHDEYLDLIIYWSPTILLQVFFLTSMIFLHKRKPPTSGSVGKQGESSRTKTGV